MTENIEGQGSSTGRVFKYLSAQKNQNPEILGQPKPETKDKKVFLEHILRPI